ncbi:MAG TPA: nitroreductase [Allosphingosinicella sp.]|nr:nitroreductase [Allosphingosinicella sp.]
MMTVTEAIGARHSARAFLDRPVPRETIAEILALAARAPSGGNLQPWHVDVLAGEALADLKALVAASLAADPRGEGTEFDVYPPGLAEPWRGRRLSSGGQLYGALGLPREDRAARLGQFAKNFDAFGAPVVLFISIPRHFGYPQWAHLGMFMQNVMLLAAERGLATCAQEAWALVHKTVGEVLRLDESRLFYCGVALGFADPDHPINGWRTERVPIEDFARFAGC